MLNTVHSFWKRKVRRPGIYKWNSFLSFSHLKKGATRQFAPTGSTHFAGKRRYTFIVIRCGKYSSSLLEFSSPALYTIRPNAMSLNLRWLHIMPENLKTKTQSLKEKKTIPGNGHYKKN